jgi:hypothetical protein
MCYVAVSNISDGKDVGPWIAVLVALPVFVIIMGFVVRRQSKKD